MARPEEYVSQYVGQLVIQCAALESQRDELLAKIAELEAKVPKDPKE